MEFAADHIQFGSVQVRYYGIIIVTAMLIAAWIAARLAERSKRDSDHIWGALTWAIFPGIVLARLWYILFPTASLTAPCDPNFVQTLSQPAVCMDAAWFLQNFFNLDNGAIAVWNGGLHIFGAILGGLLGMWLYFGPLHHPVAKFFHILFGILPAGPVLVGLLYPIIPTQLFGIWLTVFIGTILVWLWPYGVSVYKIIRARQLGDDAPAFELPKYESTFPAQGMSLLPWLDLAGVVLPLAQFVGRWANYINQELYGIPTGSSWWGIAIDRDHRVGAYTNQTLYPYENPTTLFHPLFLYEGLWNLVAFFVLYSFYDRNRNKFRQGDFFLMYIAQYGFIRFWLEFLRAEPALLAGINTSQVLAAVACVVAVILLFVRFNARRGQEGGYEVAAPAPEA